MKVGLYNLEPFVVNSAMMQVSAYHQEQGDEVELYNHLLWNTYDKVYAFSLFDFTPKCYIRPNMEVGGTGFDIHSKLPPEIVACDYDWSLYPHCDHSIVWFSRGCIRDCPFCVVREKEGYIRPVEPKNLNPNGKWIRIMDNNFFASPKWREAIEILQSYNQPVEFDGIDIRIITKEQCEALLKLRYKSQIHIAWDDPKEDVRPYIKKALKYIKPYRFMCYVLIGYWSTPEEDLFRINELRKLDIDPFVMPFNKHDDYQKSFARYVNHKAIYNTVSWEEYKSKPIKYEQLKHLGEP